MTIPHICLASSGEAERVKEYADVFSSDGRVGEVDTYTSMSHGWMGTKSDLSKEENVKEFERGCATSKKTHLLILPLANHDAIQV